MPDNLSHLPLIPPQGKQEPTNLLMTTLESLAESLLYYPEDVPVFPLGFGNIRELQQNDPVILALAQQGIYTYPYSILAAVLLCLLKRTLKLEPCYISVCCQVLKLEVFILLE